MLKKPEKYDEIEVNELEFTPIELGGHKGVIKNVEEYDSPFSQKRSLKVYVDTDKTDKQPEYFAEQYRNNTKEDKKWSNQAIKYVSLSEEENCVRMLKAFITAVENSNPNFKFDWDKEVSQLKDKKIGLVFGLEEYTANDGNIKTIAKLNQFRSVDKVDNAKIPKVKTINNEYIDYEEYQSRKSNAVSAANDIFGDVVEIGGSELPF